MTTVLDAAAPALAMLAAFLLAGFGARLVWLGADRRKGALMLVMAVLLGNVAIWTW